MFMISKHNFHRGNVAGRLNGSPCDRTFLTTKPAEPSAYRCSLSQKANRTDLQIGDAEKPEEAETVPHMLCE